MPIDLDPTVPVGTKQGYVWKCGKEKGDNECIQAWMVEKYEKPNGDRVWRMLWAGKPRDGELAADAERDANAELDVELAKAANAGVIKVDPGPQKDM